MIGLGEDGAWVDSSPGISARPKCRRRDLAAMRRYSFPPLSSEGSLAADGCSSAGKSSIFMMIDCCLDFWIDGCWVRREEDDAGIGEENGQICMSLLNW